MIAIDQLTDEQLERHALELLQRELGPDGLARFLRLNRSGTGDYTRGREQWQKDLTLDQILNTGDPLPPHRVLDFVKVKGKKVAVELIQILDVDLPKTELEVFAQARKLYSEQKWDEAISLFEQTTKSLIMDGKNSRKGWKVWEGIPEKWTS